MPDPRWRQIAEDLRAKIESGELGRDGKPLPSELELRDQYEASRNTVRDAVKWLAMRSLVSTRPGQGTFVVKRMDPFRTSLSDPEDDATKTYVSEVEAARRTATVGPPVVQIRRAADTQIDELGLEPDSLAVSRHQRRFIDDTPWSLQTTFYPMEFVTRGASNLLAAEDMPSGAVKYLIETLSIRPAGWNDLVKVRPPDASEANFFQLPDDGRVAVLEHRRTAFDTEGTPFRLTITTYPADRNEITFTVHY
ncbi:MAG TPA: GntR family transcriptional regulator [Streptosporangiaceae bacterium]|jgi:GntR family transcriptional regulator